jgi:hypothetical protein
MLGDEQIAVRFVGPLERPSQHARAKRSPTAYPCDPKPPRNDGQSALVNAEVFRVDRHRIAWRSSVATRQANDARTGCGRTFFEGCRLVFRARFVPKMTGSLAILLRPKTAAMTDDALRVATLTVPCLFGLWTAVACRRAQYHGLPGTGIERNSVQARQPWWSWSSKGIAQGRSAAPYGLI